MAAEELNQKITHSAGGVVISTQGKVLVVNQGGNSWSLPKGHIEKDENIEQAARREIFEEAGVETLVFMKEFPIYERFKIGPGGQGEDKSEQKFIHMSLFYTDQVQLQPRDINNPEAIWLEPEKVLEVLTHPKDQAFYASILPDIKTFIQSRAL